VSAALDAGITFFDTADIYGRPSGRSEEYLGKALKGRRDEAIVATKFGGPMGEDPEQRGGSARWVARAVEGSLSRLGTDRIDLYQMHFPDAGVPIAETLEALDRLVRDGKVLEIGCSNFTGAQIDEAMEVSSSRGLARLASAQNYYNLLHRAPEDDVVPACERHGLGLLPYFPLANGLLTGKYRRGEPPPADARLARLPSEQTSAFLTDRNFEIVEKLEKLTAERGHTLLELAVSWLASRPAVASVIAGATKPEQVRANASAASWMPSPEELGDVDGITL
jgi:aryl-alcohol dehydrogenase-like predicted oxidoreductase